MRLAPAPAVRSVVIVALLGVTAAPLSAQARRASAPSRPPSGDSARARSGSAEGADSAAAHAARGDSVRGSPVVYAGDTLFSLYGALGPFDAAARAAAVPPRLDAARRAGLDTVVVGDHDGVSEIVVGDRVVMTVVDGDAAPLGEPRALLAQRYGAVLRGALRRAVESVSLERLAVDAAFALLATLALALVLWAMSWGFPRVYRRIEALRRVRRPSLRIQQLELLSPERLARLLHAVVRGARLVLTLVVLYVYVPLVLSFFPWTVALSHRIIGYALRPFGTALAGFASYLPNLFYLAAGVVIARYVLVFLRAVFDALGTGAMTLRGFYADWADPTYKIARVLMIAFTAIALYPYLPGASSDAFKGVSLFLGVLVSLGSSGAVGNMVAGVVLTYTRAFQLGDRVQIGETVGDVIEKTLLVTRVRTPKNVAVTIPNGAVLSSHVVNFTTLAAGPGLILHTTVTIGYDAPWRQVHQLLVEAARRTPSVLADPQPFVLQTSLDDFFVSYELNAYTDRADLIPATYSRLHENIQETFAAGGVEIMSPHYAALRDGNRSTTPGNPGDGRGFRVDVAPDHAAPDRGAPDRVAPDRGAAHGGAPHGGDAG